MLNSNINTPSGNMNGASDSSINTTSSSSSSEDELPAPPLNANQYQRFFGTVTRAPKMQYRQINWRHHVDEKMQNGTLAATME
jgi:hypothetical protein